MGKDQVPGHIVGLTSYCLMTYPFHSMSISSPIPEISNSDHLKIHGQGSGCGRRWRSKSAQHPINLLPFHLTSIKPPEVQLFQNLTSKIQGQGYG